MTDFNMFGTRVLAGIFAKVDGAVVVTKNGDPVELNSVVEIARDVCFLENHEVRQCPTKVQVPLVLFLST